LHAELINEIAAAYEPRKSAGKAVPSQGEAASRATLAFKLPLQPPGAEAADVVPPTGADGRGGASKQVSVEGADMLDALAALASPELEPGETAA
jgi:hypothetical protein